ncbi:MAG TPA: transcriptional regulator [Flavobacteriaceae bacterium]|nr:transcriptional regulator [Flavobacteriaceae bacterium]
MNEIKNSLPISVGKRVKYFRLQQKLTQVELANLTGKDRQYIYKIEKGIVTSSIVTITLLAKAMEISLKEFFSEGFD